VIRVDPKDKTKAAEKIFPIVANGLKAFLTSVFGSLPDTGKKIVNFFIDEGFKLIEKPGALLAFGKDGDFKPVAKSIVLNLIKQLAGSLKGTLGEIVTAGVDHFAK
jgi:hypothetical protein